MNIVYFSPKKELGIFYQSRYCRDHGNQGPDNQGLAVNILRPKGDDARNGNVFTS